MARTSSSSSSLTGPSRFIRSSISWASSSTSIGSESVDAPSGVACESAAATSSRTKASEDSPAGGSVSSSIGSTGDLEYCATGGAGGVLGDAASGADALAAEAEGVASALSAKACEANGASSICAAVSWARSSKSSPVSSPAMSAESSTANSRANAPPAAAYAQLGAPNDIRRGRSTSGGAEKVKERGGSSRGTRRSSPMVSRSDSSSDWQRSQIEIWRAMRLSRCGVRSPSKYWDKASVPGCLRRLTRDANRLGILNILT